MANFLNRYKWFLLLAILLLFNVARYWPAKHQAQYSAGGPPGGPGPGGFPEPDAAMLARIDALPDDQKLAVQNWMKEGKDFFATIQNLPQAERDQKLQEHFAQNPPPPGTPFGGPPPDGGGPPPGGGPPGGPGGPGRPGGPGDGGAPRIPPPAQRRGMDQGIVNHMKSEASQ